MKPLPESRHWIEAPCTSITDDRQAAVLVLRLALAVNALRSQQAHTLLIGDDPKTASGKRDRVLSFVIAAAFITEALNILTGTGGVAGESKAVLALAKNADVPDEFVKTVRQLMAGTHPASAVLRRIRNQLTFHWDPGVIRGSLKGFETDEPLIWAEGQTTTQGGSFYRLAADVLADAMIVNKVDVPDGEEDKAGSEALKAAILAIVDAMVAVSSYFEHAIAGYITQYGTPKTSVPEQ
jgi:hypothetical protein